jgi:RNA polymerase sigma factor (TIGR02999 family)
VIRIFKAIDEGDLAALHELFPLVYDELLRLAAHWLTLENPSQTLQAAALVHEAYVRLVGPDATKDWEDRGYFYSVAAEAMRRILIDRARNRQRLELGGRRRRESIDLDTLITDDAPSDDLIDLDEALGRMARFERRAAEVVKLRLYVGLTPDEVAETMGVARRTVERDWSIARAWLLRQLDPGNPP